MNRDEEVCGNSFVPGDIDFLNPVFQDDSAFGNKSNNLPRFMVNAYPLEQFNANHEPNNRVSSLASSVPVTPPPNEGSPFANQQLFNDTNIDFGNGAESNILLEGYSSAHNQPSNNFGPLNRSRMIGGTSLDVAHQSNVPQSLADTPHSNIDSCQWYDGDNRCCGIQESATGIGTSSATCIPSLIAKEPNQSPLNNSEVNPRNISHPRNNQFILDGSTAALAEKEDLPIQGLLELPDIVKKLIENDGKVEGLFEYTLKYAEFAAKELGKKLQEQAETDPKREKGRKNRNIHAKMSNKKRPAKELHLRGIVSVLFNNNKTLVQETKRLKQESQARLKRIEELVSRSNPTELSEQPPSDDSNGGNSGGDSSGREPEAGEPSSRNNQAVGFNRMTFGDAQPSRNGSTSANLEATPQSRISVEEF